MERNKMTAQDHIIAWIESSRPHYDRLREIEISRKLFHGIPGRSCELLRSASRLVTDAYWEMFHSGDASREDPYSPADLALAVSLVLAWELES
jgi:hypothetical protein